MRRIFLLFALLLCGLSLLANHEEIVIKQTPGGIHSGIPFVPMDMPDVYYDDVDSTIVTYYSNDGQIGTDTISTSSVTLNGISPNSSIMLYKHNYIPFIAPMALQNTTLSNSQYVIASDVTAGRSVDSGRASGKVTVAEGVEYEIEASGEVTLAGGFTVEKGATFSVRPSTYK